MKTGGQGTCARFPVARYFKFDFYEMLTKQQFKAVQWSTRKSRKHGMGKQLDVKLRNGLFEWLYICLNHGF